MMSQRRGQAGVAGRRVGTETSECFRSKYSARRSWTRFTSSGLPCKVVSNAREGLLRLAACRACALWFGQQSSCGARVRSLGVCKEMRKLPPMARAAALSIAAPVKTATKHEKVTGRAAERRPTLLQSSLPLGLKRQRPKPLPATTAPLHCSLPSTLSRTASRPPPAACTRSTQPAAGRHTRAPPSSLHPPTLRYLRR